jgi:hypothetical protein
MYRPTFEVVQVCAFSLIKIEWCVCPPAFRQWTGLLFRFYGFSLIKIKWYASSCFRTIDGLVVQVCAFSLIKIEWHVSNGRADPMSSRFLELTRIIPVV